MNYQSIYSSKFGLIKEDHSATYENGYGKLKNKKVFSIPTGITSKLSKHDHLIRKGFDFVLYMNDLDFENSYVICELGHAHLPPLGLKLLDRGLDVYFHLKGKIEPRFSLTAKACASEWKQKKSKLTDWKGVASCLDLHRDKQIKLEKLLPSPAKINELGLERCYLLAEELAGFEAPQDFSLEDMEDYIASLESEGIDCKTYGIDPLEFDKQYRDPQFYKGKLRKVRKLKKLYEMYKKW